MRAPAWDGKMEGRRPREKCFFSNLSRQRGKCPRSPAGVFAVQLGRRPAGARTLERWGRTQRKRWLSQEAELGEFSRQLQAETGWDSFSTSCKRNQSKPLCGVRNMGDVKLL